MIGHVDSIIPPVCPSRSREHLRTIDPLPRFLPRARRAGPLSCPYCRQRSARPQTGRVYLCFNPDCPGGPEQAGEFASVLIVDARQGARLVPWREARRINEERVKDPLAALRS